MKKLKFACADFTFPLLSHEKVLDLIVLLDCEGVDIGLFSGRSHLRPESAFHEINTSAKELKKQIESRGLTSADVFLQLHTDHAYYAINHPEKKRREFARTSFLKLLDFATALEADHITILPGMSFPGEPEQEALKRTYEELSWRLEKVKNSPLSFGVEPHVGSPFQTPKEAKALADSVPGLMLTLDYTHFIRNGYAQSEIDPLLSHASHFHARGAKAGRLQTSMSQNIIDYGKIVEDLIKIEYTGWIGLEFILIDWEGCNEVDTLSETILLRDLIRKAAENYLTSTTLKV